MSQLARLLVLIVFGAAGAALLLFQLETHHFTPRFVEAEVYQWEQLENCSTQRGPKRLYNWQQAVGTAKPDAAGAVDCRTELFPLHSRKLALEYAAGYYRGPRPAFYTLSVQTADGATLASVKLPRGEKEEHLRWHELPLELPETVVGERVRVVLQSEARRHSAWVSLRNRANFYEAPSALETRLASLKQQLSAVPLTVALSVLLAVAALFLPLPRGGKGLFLLLAAVCVGVHLRAAPYFYYDEWHVLGRYRDLGFPGVIYTHNEHFLPIFFALYYLECKLLGDGYLWFLIVSCLLHALNCVLLIALFKRLSPWGSGQRAAVILALFFLVNALHVELLQWAFEQCLLLGQTAMLVALICGWDYVMHARLRALPGLLIGTFSAPLLFGNGFSFPAQLALLLLFGRPPEIIAARDRAVPRRAVVALVLSCLMLVVPAVLYVVNREGAGHNIDQARPFDNLSAVGSYLFVGTQLGGVLRGLGFYPSLTMDEAPALYNALSGAVALPNSGSAEMTFAGLGMLVSLMLLGVCLLIKPRGHAMRLWILGQGLIVAALLLPAAGRWSFGVAQSLALRYHYGTLIGVCVMLLPLVNALCEYGGSASPGRSRAAKLVLGGCIALVIAAHLRLLQDFQYFTEHGIKDRLFARQAVDWAAKLPQVPAEEQTAVWYAGPKHLQGGEPLFPPTITPGRHPVQLYHVLEWLGAAAPSDGTRSDS